jgi:PAS domain S-box-containing protein
MKKPAKKEAVNAHAENSRNGRRARQQARRKQTGPQKPHGLTDGMERLRATIEASVDCVITIDAQSTILEFNAAAERTFGYAREEVIGKPLPEMIIPPSLREGHRRGMAALLKGGTNKLLGKRVEMPAMRSDGSEFPVELTVTQIAGQTPPIFTAYLRDITERKRDEEAVKQSDDRIRLVIDTIPTLAWTLQPDGDVDFVNQRWLDYTGLSLAEAVADSKRIVHPEDLSRGVEKWEPAMAAGSLHEDEIRLRGANGEYRWFLLRISPLHDAAGNVVRWYGAAVDIQDRKQAEMQVHTLIDAIPHQIWSSPANGALDYCNEQWRSYMGLEQEELCGDGWQSMLHPEDRERVLQAWRTAVSTGADYEQEERHRAADGSYRWFLARGVAMRDAGGRIVRWYGTNTDIEDYKKARVALSEQALRYKTLMETSTDSIYVVNEEGDLQEANAAFRRRRGYTAADLKGLNIADWDAQWDREQIVERIRQLGDGSSIFETRHRSKDGSVFDVEISATSVRINGDRLLFCVTREITERKKAESALRQLAQVSAVSSDYIALIGRDFRYQFVNDTYLKARGRHREDMIGRHMKEIVGEERFEQLGRPQVEACLRGEEVESFEWTDFRPDLRCFLHVKVAPLREPDGTICGAVMSGRDITERKRAEGRLRKVGAQLADAQRVAHIGSWEWDIATDTVSWSDETYRIMGFEPQEIPVTYATFLNCLHPDDRAHIDEAVQQASRDHQPCSYDYRAILPDGRVRFQHVEATVVTDESGRAVRMIGTTQDITERKAAADALRESETRFRQVAENINEVFWLADPEATLIHYVSPAYEKIWGRSCDSLYAEPSSWMDSIHPDDRERVAEGVRLQEVRGRHDHTYRIVRPDGSLRWIRDRAFPVSDESGKLIRVAGIAEDITERKRAEDQLRRSEEKFKTLFGIAPVGIAFLDSRMNLVDCNRALERMSGLSRQELLGGSWRRRTFLNADGSPRLWSERVSERGVRERRHFNGVETGAVLENGDIVWAEVSVAPLAIPDASAVVIMHDITERKRAEERLQEYERAVEGLEEMIAVVDRDYRYLLANRAFLNFRGLERQQLIGRPVVEVLGREAFARIADKLRECLAGNTVRYETRYRFSDGRERDLLASYSPIEGPGGIDRIACVFQDITERKKAEAALRESETRFRQITENIEEVFWITDLAGTTIYISPAYERIWGRSCESLYASPRSWREQIHPADRSRMEPSFSSDPGFTRAYIYRIVRADGSFRWIRDRGFPVHDECGNVVRFAGIAEDITATKSVEEELQRVNEQLRVLSWRLFRVRDEERRHLARELHDEIGQALTAAKINLSSIDSPSVEEQAERLQESIALLDTLLRQVRQISLDLHPSTLDDLGLVPALRSLLDQQAQRAGLRARFSAVERAEIDRGIQTTAFRITQEAITNVLRHAQARFIGVRINIGKDRMKIRIVDDGIGFDTSPIQSPGNGEAAFGLVGMRERASLVGGQVRITSSPGKGTTVEVSLPINRSREGRML